MKLLIPCMLLTVTQIMAASPTVASTVEGLTFTVADDGNMIPSHFHSCYTIPGFTTCPGGEIDSNIAEVGTTFSYTGDQEDIRGLAEFDITGLASTPYSSVTLSFDVLFSGGLILENFARSFTGDINIVTYQANNQADISDWGATSTGAVSTFNTTGLNVGDTLNFDITAIFNETIASGQSSFGVRLNAVPLPDTSAWTFNNFRVTAVPVPPAIYLFGTGLLWLMRMAFRKPD